MNWDSLTDLRAQLDTFRPLPPALLRNLEEWFRVELTYSSNAIEGNTLTRQETALVVEKGLTVGGKTLTEHLEATNHAKALDWVQAQVKRQPRDLEERDLLTLHELVLRGIDDAHAGRYRSIPVRIAGSTTVLPNPRKVPELMEVFVAWMQHEEAFHPVALAAEAHYRLVTIHPFVDGNGRTARLLMNLLLMMAGYPPAIIRPEDRIAYLNAMETAQTGGSKAAYNQLIHEAVQRSLMIYLDALSGETKEPDTAPARLKIGELAKQVDAPTSTIRFWTKHGLLHVADTTASGYQLYDQSSVDRVHQIRELKAQRFTLEEIKGKLSNP